jgi:peptide/nickel transport system permease protein
MTGFILRRLLASVGVLWAMTLVIFAIVHILPGNVAYAILGEYATPSAVAVLQAKLGLNDPLPVQYWHWFRALLHGDFGQSLVMERPAAPVILEALQRSAVLAGISFVLVASGGILLGIYAATHRGRMGDRLLMVGQFLFIAVPDFFWSILAILLFASWMNWLPATGYAPLGEVGVLGWAAHLVLPVSVLSAGLVAHVCRLTRSSMLEVLESRYILAARAKGLPERLVLRRHALPNALLPSITILAIDAGLLIGGVVVVETVFAYPGLGRLLVFAIEHHDLPLLQAGMIVLTAIYALANLVADVCYGLLNPRIRHARSAA